MFKESTFWNQLKNLHKFFMDIVISEFSWFGDSDFTTYPEEELNLLNFKSLKILKNILNLLADLPFESYERKLMHTFKNIILMKIKNQGKYFNFNQENLDNLN